jgi:hypothetical protein
VTQQSNPETSTYKTVPIPRQPDAQEFYLHCSGGFRAAMSKKDVWIIEPVMHNGQPCRKGFLTKAQLDAFVRKAGLTPIAFQSLNWTDGRFHSSWSPMVAGRKNHLRGPADLWSAVASNLANHRFGAELRNTDDSTREEIAALLDDRTEEEWLARSISLSLRSMDTSVQQMGEFYHEQLVNLLAAGLVDGRRFASIQNQSFFAHVHSFFMHLGAARDYLAALIATRIGKAGKIDSMARLIDALRSYHMGVDALLDLLETRKLIQPAPANPNRRVMSGWFKEASDLRNLFLHRRPYGARSVEQFGHAVAVAAETGLYRYVQPVLVENDVKQDILDVVVSHYMQATALFQDAAEVSGRDISMITLTDKDIIAIKKT